ncbi:hypothetical protein [Actinocorallia herbida]|nr:hypothetical protein [Actinocorallia herbida]
MTRWLLALVGNATMITALLVYFGWQRNEAMYKALGFDESILGLSTRDYLLRSINPALTLVLIIGMGGLLFLGLDRWSSRALGAPGSRRARLALALCCAAVLIVVASRLVRRVPVLSDGTLVYALFPLGLGLGVFMVFCAARPYLAAEDAHLVPPAFFVWLIVAATLFWATSNYAAAEGRAAAADVEPGSLTGVTVYSPYRLELGADEVAEKVLESEPTTAKEPRAYLYRYTGLRLLERIGDRYFLISDAWIFNDRQTLTVLSDEDPIRLEFTPR